MGRSVKVLDIGIVGRLLIGVADNETNWRTAGHALKYSRENLHFVSFLPRSSKNSLTRTTSVEFRLNEIQVHMNTYGKTIDNSSKSIAMTFAESSQPIYISECIHLSDCQNLFTSTAAAFFSAAVTATTATATAAIATEHIKHICHFFI